MNANRILQLNATATAATALAMLATRQVLYPFFGLATPLLLDVVAIGFLSYAAVLALAARRARVERNTLLAFTAADALWVAASAVALVLFWGDLTVIGRALVIAVAVVVELFATLQFLAAGRVTTAAPLHA